MDYHRLRLIINTVRHLKLKQVLYRIFYFLKKRYLKRYNKKKLPKNFAAINWKDSIYNYTSYFDTGLKFNFLNISHSFKKDIDWNYQYHGKLWIYNLNYFDFLNQKNISKGDGLLLIKDFIKKKESLKDGNEPYPVSLRCVNWIKFLSKNKIYNGEINSVLYNDFIFLSKNLEYHLLGNHLLENAFSLLFGSYFFQDKKLYHKSKKLIEEELREQILKDGAHFELSPMYHQTLLFKLLDCINLIKLNKYWNADDLLIFLENKASQMLSWLKNITYMNGDIPMVNDATYNIAPISDKLFKYAKEIGISTISICLSDSGYRKINKKNYELFIDIGNIGPDYQPGHSHCDTLSFELHINKSHFIIDTGISTYENNAKRQKQRSTESHNTVKIDKKDQSEIWGGFRVGNRAKILRIMENNDEISASHNGYSELGIIHKRIFKWNNDQIKIIDSLNKSSNGRANAFFHLHSSVDKPVVKNNIVFFNKTHASMSFINSSSLKIEGYKLSNGFNKQKTAYKIVVNFDKTLISTINL